MCQEKVPSGNSYKVHNNLPITSQKSLHILPVREGKFINTGLQWNFTKGFTCATLSQATPTVATDHIPTYLVNDIDAIRHLLSSKNGMQVVQPVLEVVLTMPEGDEDGHLLARHTVWG